MTKSQKKDLCKIAVAATLFIAGEVTHIFWFFLGAYIVSGWKAFYEAFQGIRHKAFLDENFLMVIASLGAFYCKEYPEAVAVMLFYLVGTFFEHYAVNKSRTSITELMDIQIEFARKVTETGEEVVEPDELEVGDIIIVRPGEKIPVDGTIIEGSSSINTSALTGESLPVDVFQGNDVISGAVNLTGAIKLKVTKEYYDSTAAKVLDLVETAASRKAHMEKFISKFARYYTPIVVGVAVVLAIIPPFIFGFDTLQHWIYTAMIFLVVSCPCALVISVPLSLFAGIGSASKHGILVKGSNYLESLAAVKTAVFDKTGTLTTGEFAVTSLNPAYGVDEKELLKVAALGESMSNHPVAVAIVNKYGKENLDMSVVTAYEEIPGKGIAASIGDNKIYCGNIRLMTSLNLDVADYDGNDSVIHIAEGEKYLGYITAADILRDNTKEALADMRSLGVKQMVMLTGDRKPIAEAIAKKAGINKVFSDLLPEDKVNALEELLKDASNKNIAYVGDGINDAPVLSRADIGIAMGGLGSDAAIEAADIVILNDDFSKLPIAVKIAKKTLSICKTNVVFALTVKFAVLLLSPFGLANMWLAVFADVGVTFIAILNAMRALRL